MHRQKEEQTYQTMNGRVEDCHESIFWTASAKYGLRITWTRGTSILGEVRNVEISRVTQQLLCSKSHDFLAVFALAHS